MNINVVTTEESEDGSLNCVVNMDDDAVMYIIRFGLVKAIEEAINLAKKEYTQQEKDNRQMELFNE